MNWIRITILILNWNKNGYSGLRLIFKLHTGEIWTIGKKGYGINFQEYKTLFYWFIKIERIKQLTVNVFVPFWKNWKKNSAQRGLAEKKHFSSRCYTCS